MSAGACPTLAHGAGGAPYGWRVDALPLARAAIDRAAHRRAGPVLATAWASDSTRVLLVRGGLVATRPGPAGSTELDLVPPLEISPQPPAEAHVPVFLGEDDDGAYLALVVGEGKANDDDGADPLPVLEGRTWSTLRDVGHLLGDRDVDLAASGVALAAWHRRNRRCGQCGGPNEPAEAGWTRRCPVDGTEDYPRTDPAVIMAVTDDADRILLGHAARWPTRRFSTLAGFVEPGESAEAAVRREVAEEVSVEIGELEYVASQPWPFPSSLMLAYRAHALTTEIEVDGEEMAEARWFTRAELQSAVQDGDVLLPMRSSVARVLIESWFGGPLDTTEDPGPGDLGPLPPVR